MSFKPTFIKLTCLHAGADANIFTDDDTFLVVNNTNFKVLNVSANPKGDADSGFPMGTGQTGFATKGFNPFEIPSLGSIQFQNSLNIQVWDSDGAEFLDFLQASPDFCGQTTLIPTGNEPLGVSSFTSIVSGSGSVYKIDFGVNNFRSKDATLTGKTADSDGGIMQGSNTAGTLIGKGGKDIIFGNNGDDILVGGANDDVLNGGKGDDIIFGGKGNDTLSGGAGKDIFVLAPHNGFDFIKDFGKGDLLGLQSSMKFDDLTLMNQAKGTLVKAGNEKLAFLQGVHQLSASDFTQIDLNNLNSRVNNDFAAISKAA
jgi:Ca2+-binding RTX toxin-like protein